MIARATSGFALHGVGANGEMLDRPLSPGQTIVGRAPECELVLSGGAVSRRHACFTVSEHGAALEDLNGENGVYVNGDRVRSVDLCAGDRIAIGDWLFELRSAGVEAATERRPAALASNATEVVAVARPRLPVPAAPRGVLPDWLLHQPLLDEQQIASAGVELRTAQYAALGGGLGSFAWVSLLRNSGIAASEIAVAGSEAHAGDRFERLCQNSQIPPRERLRSNSDARPDNLWGFPGYAVSELLRDAAHLRLGSAGRILWQIAAEPALAETYTPRRADIFAGVNAEAERIGWPAMLLRGRILAIRKSSAGRLLAVVSQSNEREQRHVVVGARYLHLALGYPGVRLLPDLVAYRERTGDHGRVLNAYEDHEHLYAQLRERGGVVILRGRGIVAARILQRLWEERQHNAAIVVVHLHRSRLVSGQRFGATRRVVEAQFEFQPFNWPKASWGGELRGRLEAAPAEERARLFAAWGGTTVPRRADWRRVVREGLREGWYRPEFGVVRSLEQGPDGRLLTRIQTSLAGGGMLDLAADFVIDCTGMEAGPERSTPIADLIETYQAPLNQLGRLQVNDDFEIEALRHGEARLYASGAMIAGGSFAGVDSFLGMQYTALRSVDALLRLGAPGLRRLDGWYSFRQWLKRARGLPP